MTRAQWHETVSGVSYVSNPSPEKARSRIGAVQVPPVKVDADEVRRLIREAKRMRRAAK